MVGSVDWFNLPLVRDMGLAVGNTVIKAKSSIKCGEFLD